MTVFRTTHYMDEAELADPVAVIAEGRIVAEGTPATLAGRDRAAAEIRFRLPPGTAAGELPEPVRCALAGTDGDRMPVRASSVVPVLGPLTQWAETRGCDLADLDVRRPSLEDIYLSLTDTKADGRR